MTNNQIQYMIEVARTGSVNQAARNLFISQSALSNAIRSVEQEFGRKIFHRSSRGVTLTPFGKLFIAYITPISHQLEQLYAMRNTDVNSQIPSLSIISNGFYYITDLLAALGERYSSNGLRVFLQEEYSGNFLEPICNRAVDLGIVRIWSCYRSYNLEEFSNKKLVYHPICELQIGVDLGEKNPLYNHPEPSIAPEMLAGYPQILHESLDHGPYSDIMGRLNLPVSSVRYVVDSRATIYELLDKTGGYVLNSRKISLDGQPRLELRHHQWRFFPLKDCSVRSEIGYLTRENTVLTPEASTFIQMLKDYLLRDIIPNY
ncbi:MAG: LysR family transcriptional regulator [Oscillospiraceae bacterium]|jgi:DNA-binding transcriptional LysR family regulator|nr:LysR family transcriptional regulator [Oscillospiraceae bacterium]